MLPVKSILTVPLGTKWEDVVSGVVVPQLSYVPALVIKSGANAKYYPIKGEVNNLPSLTVPNAAMTVRELLIRFASGLPLSGAKTKLYEGESDLPDIESMDRIELHNYYKELSAEREEAIKRTAAAREKAEEQKMEKIIEERVQMREAEEEKKVIEEYRKKKKGGEV